MQFRFSKYRLVLGTVFLSLVGTLAYTQTEVRIRELTEVTADGISSDGAVWFGVDKTDVPASRKISLAELKKVGVQVVNVKQYGATGDGVADDTAEIQAAIDAAAAQTNRPIVYLPPGKYLTTSTLTVTEDCIAIVGGSMPSIYRGSESSGTTRGATIRYNGTGTAVQVGVAPGTNGTFIQGTRIENIRIEVNNDTDVGLQVWHSSHGCFRNISIFGNKGTSNTGLLVQAGIDNIYEQIEVSGIGQTVTVVPTEYAVCLKADLGYNNDQATTTIFRRCYFHYGYIGALMNYRFDFEDCIFEACDRGVQMVSGGLFESSFSRCWFEANVTWDIYFNGSFARLTDCKVNSYARQEFFASGSGVEHVCIRDTEFSTTHVAPILFSTANNITSATGAVVMSGNQFPTAMTLGGSGYARGAYNIVKNIDMPLAIYRFAETTVGASETFNPMSTGLGTTSWRMPTDGHIVGLHVYGNNTLAAGAWDIAVKINGTAVPDFSYPTIGFQSSSEVNFKKTFYDNFFAEGDDLTVYFHTDGSVSPSMDYTVEVIVALGDDGIE